MAINDEIPKSRITLTYRTEVSGEREERNIPFRMLVMGDLSLENTADAETTSSERDKDLDERLIRDLNGTNLDTVMKDMGMRIKFSVPNQITGGELDVDLPIEGMRSFTPEHIVKHVKELEALVLFKKLLVELQGNMDNRKEFRNSIRAFNTWRRKIKEAPKEIELLKEQIELEQEPLEKNKLTQKLEQTEKDLESAKKNLETFMGHVDSALSKYSHLSLPGGTNGDGAGGGAADAGGGEEAPAGE